MAFSSGSFTRLYNFVADKLASVKITASRMDAEFDGMATGLSTCVLKDGTQTMTAALPLGGFKITGLGDAAADTDALNRQSADARFARIVGGTSMGTVAAVAASTVTLSSGRYFTKTVSGDLTWVFSGPVATGSLDGFILVLTNGGTGTQTWPASVDWPSGVAPTLTTSGVDVLVFITADGGTTWRGSVAQRDSR